MNIKDLQIRAHHIAADRGWHDEPRTIGELLVLCHSELSEALEEYRLHPFEQELNIIRETDHGPEGFGVELADCIIRIADMAEHLGIDLTEAIRVKMEYNRTRPYRHGGKRI